MDRKETLKEEVQSHTCKYQSQQLKNLQGVISLDQLKTSPPSSHLSSAHLLGARFMHTNLLLNLLMKDPRPVLQKPQQTNTTPARRERRANSQVGEKTMTALPLIYDYPAQRWRLSSQRCDYWGRDASAKISAAISGQQRRATATF